MSNICWRILFLIFYGLRDPQNHAKYWKVGACGGGGCGGGRLRKHLL